MIEYYQDTENPYRREILELMAENNEETTPSIQEMTNMWIAEENLGLESAVEKFYRERTDEVVVNVEGGELKGFFLLEENDEGIKDKIPEYWPHIEISLGVVKKQYRGEGVSSKLIKHVENNLTSEKGRENLVWVTSTANKASQNFAEKHSLKEVARFSEDREDGEKTVIFAKKV